MANGNISNAEQNARLDSAIDKAASEAYAEETKSETTSTETAASETPVTETASETPATETETASETTTLETQPEGQQTQETQTQDDDVDNLSVPSEEIARIKNDPALHKLWKGMNKVLTQKTMEIADDRRLIDAIRNPDTRVQAIKAIASLANLQLQEAGVPTDAAPKTKADEIVDATMMELNKVFDPQVSAALKPVLENIARNTAKAILDTEVAPWKAATEELSQKAMKEQSDAEVRAFKSKHNNEITPDIEAKMVGLFKKLPPSDDIDPSEYMEYLYRIVRDDTKKVAAVKEVTTRMADAAKKQEPKGGIQPSRVTSTNKPERPAGVTKDQWWNSRFDDAFQEAREGR